MDGPVDERETITDVELDGASLRGVNLRGAALHTVRLNDARLTLVNLSGVELRGAYIGDARLIGLDLENVEITTGDLENVTINGVDIGPLVEQELDRREPERIKMRPTDADGYREAWEILERRWAETVERARSLPEPKLHESVRGEWSFIQTLRHLGFATAAWIGRMVQGDLSPWHPLDLPWDQAPGWDGIPWDRDARPDLDTVLAVRRDRQAMVRDVLSTLTDDRLDETVSRPEPGWPDYEDLPVRLCLQTVVIEEWEHRRFAERDLDALADDQA